MRQGTGDKGTRGRWNERVRGKGMDARYKGQGTMGRWKGEVVREGMQGTRNIGEGVGGKCHG
jgi:hypothetical protein